MLHWPETMVTFETTRGILFSGDIFGAFGTLDGGIFDDEVDLDYLEEEISRYYSNIVGKFGQPAQMALRKLGNLPIRMICATHGPIRRSYISDIIAKYDTWSKYNTDKGVVIAFSSMYGHTERMADAIARALVEQGIKKIRVHDTSKTHPSYIINDIFRYRGVILGSCAYNTEIFPTMETLLIELEHLNIKNHLLAYFGEKSWSGGSIKRFEKFAENSKWEVVHPFHEAWGAPKVEDIDACRLLARTMADRLHALYPDEV
jgi:flavorubredoxin